MGSHRAEDQPDKKSTSERVEGKRNDASKSKHAAGKKTLGRVRRDDKGDKKDG